MRHWPSQIFELDEDPLVVRFAIADPDRSKPARPGRGRSHACVTCADLERRRRAARRGDVHLQRGDALQGQRRQLLVGRHGLALPHRVEKLVHDPCHGVGRARCRRAGGRRRCAVALVEEPPPQPSDNAELNPTTAKPERGGNASQRTPIRGSRKLGGRSCAAGVWQMARGGSRRMRQSGSRPWSESELARGRDQAPGRDQPPAGRGVRVLAAFRTWSARPSTRAPCRRAAGSGPPAGGTGT